MYCRYMTNVMVYDKYNKIFELYNIQILNRILK